MEKANRYPLFLIVVIWLLPYTCYADGQWINGVIIAGLEQKSDDEEAPFEMIAANKKHECNGEASQAFRMYSEYNSVQDRRFKLAITAFLHKKPVTLYINGCEGNAMLVERLVIRDGEYRP